MEINNIGYVNLKGSEVENSEKTKSVTPEQKEVQASANNALGNYGKAFINMSFKGNVQNSPETTSEIKELSDEEFEEYKTKLSEKIKLLPDNVQKTVNGVNITKTNILLADRILSDENLYSNEYLPDFLKEVLESADSLEKESYKIELIDLFTSDDRLRNDNCIRENMLFNILQANDSEFVDVKRKVKEKIYSTSQEDNFVMNNVGFSMCAIDNFNQYELFDKIIQAERYKKNLDEMSGVLKMCALADTTEKIDFLDSFVSENKIINFSVMENIFESEIASKSTGLMTFVYDHPDNFWDDGQKVIKKISNLNKKDFEKFEKVVNNENFKKMLKIRNFEVDDVMSLSKLQYDSLNDILNALLSTREKTYSPLLTHNNPDESITDIILDCYKLTNGARINKKDVVLPIKLQYDAGDMLTITKNTFSKDKTNPNNPNILQHSTIVTKNGEEVIRSKVEKAGNESTSWNISSNRTVILNRNDNQKDVDSQFEIVKKQNGEPFCIIHTKESELLEGTYNSTIYFLEGFDEDTDIISAIKDGTIEDKIKEGYNKEDVIAETSKVSKLDDGTVTLFEKNAYNDTKSERSYIQKPDGSYEYKYDIKDEDGNSVFSMDRSFIKSPDGKSTKTIINGKEYTTTYDDKEMTATVVDYNGETTTINLKDKLAKPDAYQKDELEYITRTFGNEENMQKAFFDFAKTIPAEHLLSINSGISEIFIVDPPNSGNTHGILRIGLNAPIVFHELGHAKDYNEKRDILDILLNPETHKGSISNNQELIDIYNEEMKLFKEKYSVDFQKTINYFGQTGGGYSDTGLAELIAETNTLMTVCGNNENEVKTRAQYLVRYFPRTVAKVGELLGYNK